MSLDVLRQLEPDFWRAPSAHNTQPWVLRYQETTVEIGWDPACALPAGDPTGRDLRLSLGAFTETCLIVCADAGLAVTFHPDFSEPDRRIGHLVSAATSYVTPFTTDDVRRRMSARVAYQPGRLDDEVVGQLDELAGAGELRRLPCRVLIRPLYEADRYLFGTPPVARELRDWLRLTPRDPRYDTDGLTDRALDLSRWEALGLRAVLARQVYPALRRLGLPRILATSSSGLLDKDGEVLVLVAPPTCDRQGQVAMGRVLMRHWLLLSRLGYATHPLSQIIDAAHTRGVLARALGIDDPDRLLNVARVGRPATPVARSARRITPA
ncbi:MAG: nitroreductase [Pseudonocardiales bacterium]|nr:MAG: nitroreductase [Pseudonocardiales bacterium]